MSVDLECQLNEMGVPYRAVVDRLRAGRTVEPRVRVPFYRRVSVSFLMAASLLIAAGVTVVVNNRSGKIAAQSKPAAAHEYALADAGTAAAIAELVRTQNPDGSWQNDFLTRRNADALRGSSDLAARVAYKKAVRNLRTRGLF